MAVWIIVCLLALHWRFSLSVPTADTKTVADTSLTDRLSHLERLVHHLDTAVHRLERGTGDSAKPLRRRSTGLELVMMVARSPDEKVLSDDIRQDFDVRRSSEDKRENDLCAGLTAEWREAKQAWEIERQALAKLLQESLQKQNCASDNGTAADTSHDAEPAFDDENTQVTDITSRLTEVIHQVENLKSSNAQIQEVQNSLNSDIQSLREANVQQDQAIQEAGSSVYVRWGNSRCPNTTSLVYSGVMGGSDDSHSGGAASPLCMSMSPAETVSWGARSIAAGGYSALYGAEYQTYDSHANKDAVCAVCRAPRPTVIMVPGTNRCHSGWTMEYSGYLMAGAYAQTSATEYTCVDLAFESRVGSNAVQDGYLLYFSVAHCGTLPCEPYVSGHLVACAVCSK